MRILGLLHRLRTICSNPAAAAYDHPEGLGVDEHLRHSPKLRWMVGRLGEIRRKGEKVIVFTEFRDIQRIVQRVIAQRFDVVPDIVNGSTSVDPEQEVSRQRLIDRFQAKPGFGVIILSTTAVGFGVNVQAANHVIHFTRPWNPAKEDQATDRAYRIGQTKPVHVYCPTVCGNGFESFDQRIDQLLGNKRALSRDMLAGAQELKIDEFGSL
jgi:SNF2 family DNA or RNA helicase